ncbi:MAG: carboxylesterase family protein, partial [Sphingobacteriaceae bacterium]
MTNDFTNATPGLAGGITKNTTSFVNPVIAAVGAPHAFEIEYAMGNLDKNKVYAWTPEDEQISATMLQYFANFVKTGSPNGSSLPVWSEISKNSNQLMNIGLKTHQQKTQNRSRYLFLDQLYQK